MRFLFIWACLCDVCGHPIQSTLGLRSPGVWVLAGGRVTANATPWSDASAFGASDDIAISSWSLPRYRDPKTSPRFEPYQRWKYLDSMCTLWKDIVSATQLIRIQKTERALAWSTKSSLRAQHFSNKNTTIIKISVYFCEWSLTYDGRTHPAEAPTLPLPLLWPLWVILATVMRHSIVSPARKTDRCGSLAVISIILIS